MSREDHGGFPAEILKEEFRRANQALQERQSRKKPLLIAHRGNLDGPNPQQENNPIYIEKALLQGYNCEIDVWYEESMGFSLGHDYPQYKIPVEFFNYSRLWCHAKNLNALHKMLEDKRINCFWHQSDNFTVTSHGFIWTYPGKELSLSSICVLPERSHEGPEHLPPCYGVCTDYPKYFK